MKPYRTTVDVYAFLRPMTVTVAIRLKGTWRLRLAGRLIGLAGRVLGQPVAVRFA